MKSFYTPDTRWDFYQISDEEEFAEKLVIEGVFHQEVPEDVIEAYETIEYLMAHSYYYWPMYDEAFNKVLFTIEMGIKLKAKELNVPIYEKRKGGKKKARSLYNIINDICDADHLGDLKNMLHRSRNLRNMQAHPK
jgi:predicted regulator of amino acid metabolism with ACT domain